jgi:predicted PurR-regulated permease PerM
MSQHRQRLFLGLLLAALLPFLLQIAWPFVSAFVLASVVATVLYPANSRLSRRLQRPGLASLLTTLATVMYWRRSSGSCALGCSRTRREFTMR